MGVVSSSVWQECTASSFRETDLIQVNVEWIGGKKMCHIITEVTTSGQKPSHEQLLWRQENLILRFPQIVKFQ